MNKILFIGGSRNQTTQMHQIAEHLMGEAECYFSAHYASGHVEWLRRLGLADMSILADRFVQQCLQYFREHGLSVDHRGEAHEYNLVVTCADLTVPKNIRHRKIVLVQEGMTDPETWAYHLVKLGLMPRWSASTAAMGLSDAYVKFCVASEGYRDLFIRKGVKAGKLVVTGIPNFDNCARFRNNDFPYRDFVLVCTSDSRETVKFENRKRIIMDAVRMANGRMLIFKLHPNENAERSSAEIRKYAPQALIYTSGSAEEMIANCDTLITQFSSVVYVGLALGKKVYSNFPVEFLERMMPVQNNSAAERIAEVCREVMHQDGSNILPFRPAAQVFRRFFRRRTDLGSSINAAGER